MKVHKLIASGFGTGYSPVAPGTAGSALGIVLLYFFNSGLVSVNVTESYILVLNFSAVLGIIFLGVFSIKKVHQVWKHDAQTIVIDEIAGVWVAAFALPLQKSDYLYAFVLFRFFDIYKPLFIRRIDRLNSDWSVMLDDLLAGVYAFIVLQLLLYFNIL